MNFTDLGYAVTSDNWPGVDFTVLVNSATPATPLGFADMQFRRSRNQSSYDLRMTTNSGGGLLITNANSWTITASAQVLTMSAGLYYWDMTTIDTSSYTRTVGNGIVTLLNGYDEETSSVSSSSNILNATGTATSEPAIVSGTYASLSSAYSGTAFTGRRFRATDGQMGFDVINNGAGRLIPLSQQIFAAMQLPVGVAPTFTGTTNGSFTLGTALATTLKKGYLYFPANSLAAAHSAGFYPVEMSSTTVGVAYNNVYVPAAGTYPTWPTSLTAFIGAVPGGTGVTSEITAFISPAIPANLLGLYGGILSQYYCDYTNSANNKTFKIKYGSTSLGQSAVTATAGFGGVHQFRNAGTAAIQRGQGGLLNTNVGTTTAAGTEDSTTALSVTYTVQLAASTDYAAWNNISIIPMVTT